MRKFLGNIYLRETSAFLAAIAAILLFLSLLWNNQKAQIAKVETKVISVSDDIPTDGVIPNYATGDVAELALLSSIARKDQITLMGSSEFSASDFASFQFLPKELNLPTLGFGHAHHQNFSIFCELLAANEYLPQSKLVIFLSPGWFETPGTNSEAFLEFVPPHFLEKIWMDSSISSAYKIEIGRFIAENENNFSGISKPMQSFLNLYRAEVEKSISTQIQLHLEQMFPAWRKTNRYTYAVQSLAPVAIKKNYSFDEMKDSLQKVFLTSCTNNSLFVDSSYFRQHLLQADGSVRRGTVTAIDIQNNREFKDFLLLIDLLQKRKVDCSFVIQGLNPYYYENLSVLNPLIREIVNELEKANFPYLNMFTSTKKEYQPGTLSDVMHLGALGWMKVNEFIYHTYIR